MRAQAYRHYEIGDRKPKTNQIEKIASILNVSPSVFYDLNSIERFETAGDLYGVLMTLSKLGILFDISWELEEPEDAEHFPHRKFRFELTPTAQQYLQIEDGAITFKTKEQNDIFFDWQTNYFFAKVYGPREDELSLPMKKELEKHRKEEAEEALKLQCIDTPLKEPEE